MSICKPTRGETKERNNERGSVTKHQTDEKNINDIISFISSKKSPNKLGEGSFGPVYAGTDNHGRAVAVKLLGEQQRNNARKHSQDNAATNKMFLTEVSVLSRLSHLNIVRLYFYGQSYDGTEQKALVYELLDTDLAKELQNNGNHFKASDRLNVAIDAARGLTYMHGQQSIEDLPVASLVPVSELTTLTEVSHSSNQSNDSNAAALPPIAVTSRIDGMAEHPCWHRDIKSANIGIQKKGNVFGDAKLLDCGLAKSRIDVTRTMITVTGGGQLGTPGFMAPEVTNSGKYGTRSEIFSFGVVLLEILTTRKASFDCGLVSFVKDAVEDEKEWIDCSCGWPSSNEPGMIKLRNLALSCVERRQNKRPATMRDVMMQLIQIRSSLELSTTATSFSSSITLVDDANDISNLAHDELVRRYRKLEADFSQRRSHFEITTEQKEQKFTDQVEVATCCVCVDA